MTMSDELFQRRLPAPEMHSQEQQILRTDRISVECNGKHMATAMEQKATLHSIEVHSQQQNTGSN